MHFKDLVWSITTNFVAIILIAKAVPQSPDSLSLNADLYQVPVDDNPQELIFSSNVDPQAALNTDLWGVSSSGPQAGAMDTAVFNDDDFLALGGTSDDLLFANSCDGNILRRGNEPSSCGATNDQKTNSDLDFLRRLGQGDALWKLLETLPGSQEDPEPIKDDGEKERLLPPFDVYCDPEFPVRLCCFGPAVEGVDFSSSARLYSIVLYSSVEFCIRCKYFALFLWEHRVYELFRAFGVFSISQRFLTESVPSIKRII